jgi:hypothetical protein
VSKLFRGAAAMPHAPTLFLTATVWGCCPDGLSRGCYSALLGQWQPRSFTRDVWGQTLADVCEENVCPRDTALTRLANSESVVQTQILSRPSVLIAVMRLAISAVGWRLSCQKRRTVGHIGNTETLAGRRWIREAAVTADCW